MSELRASKVGSIAGLKRSLKKGSGGTEYLSRIPANGERKIRFLSEPSEWISYYEHFNPVDKFFPCASDCKGCAEGNRPASRYLANALDIDDDRVIPLVLPQTAVGQLLKFYDKYATILDRDYEVSREGEGKENTEYFVLPGDRAPRKLDKYDELDLMKLLQAQIHDDDVSDDDDDDDEDEVVEAPVKKARVKKAPVAAEPDDDDDDDEDDEDDEADTDTRESLGAMSRAQLRTIAKGRGHTASDIRGLDSDALVDLIVGEDEPDDDEPDDDDADLEISEEDLEAMSLAELKKLAGDIGITVARGVDKDHLIELILDLDDEGEDEPPF